MHLPLLTALSGGRSTPVPDDDWAGLVEAAIGGDDVAVRRVFAAAARWANQLIHQRSWLLDAEAEIVALLWDTLHARPGSSDDWRTLVRRRLTRRQYRPSPEVATPREILEHTVPGGEFEARVLDQLDARRTLRTLGPMPPGMGPYLSAVWADQPPAPAAAQRPPVPVPAAPSRRMNRRRRTASLVVTVAVVAACDSPNPAATAMPSSTTMPSSTAPPLTTPPSPPAPADDGGAASPGAVVNPDEPIEAGQLTPAPAGLGPMFLTGDEPLPAQTTAAVRDAGGQALNVNTALTAFGVLGVPRPSGASSAVMELDVTATRLAATDGTSLSTEVLYLVSSTSRIDDLLVDAAHTIDSGASASPSTVPDYDGTTGDPRCARLPLDTGTPTAASVEGCEYRSNPLTEVRSIGFRRLNLLVTGPPALPPVFADVPAELLAAGELAGYTASFGRPTGPSGNTVQLRVQVHLDAALTGLGEGWQADGPGRWWADTATVTVDAGTATWQSSTRAAP